MGDFVRSLLKGTEELMGQLKKILGTDPGGDDI